MKRKFTVKVQLSKQPGIYEISCAGSDKVYIGESVDISRRIQKHFALLRHNKHSNPVLQNLFNKYGEESFVVNVLEYTTNSDDVFLKTLEQKYQKACPNCISFDSNQIYHIERSDEWKQKQGGLLNKHREAMLESWRIPITIYDIVEKRTIEFKQMSEAAELVEMKHLKKNVDEHILIPYKHRYVAFKTEEFSEDMLKEIIVSNTDKPYSAVRNICYLYNLLDGSFKKFASKDTWSLEFSNKSNWQLYDTMKDNKFVDWNFRTPCEVKTKSDFLNLNIYVRNTSRSKKCNVKVWYESLQNSNDTFVNISNKCGLSRHVVSQALHERDQIEWIKLIKKVLRMLPD